MSAPAIPAVSIDISECFRAPAAAYVAEYGVTVTFDQNVLCMHNYGSGHIIIDVISDADADRMDAAVIESRRGKPSEPLDKALGDLGLS